MTLEWLRRQDPVLDRHLRTYLFTEGSIVEEEHEAEHGSDGPMAATRVIRTPAAMPGRARGRFARHRQPPRPLTTKDVSMNHLFRDLAPISEKAWHEIETEAKRALENFLASRRLIDFTGPHGWAETRDHPRHASTCCRTVRSPTSRARRATCSRWSSCAPGSCSNGPSSTRSTVGTRRPTSSPSSTPPAASRRPRTRPCSTATPTARINGIVRRVAARAGRARRLLRRVPALGRDGGRPPARRGRRGPVRHRARPPLLRRHPRDDRGRRLPGARAPAPHPRRARGVRARRSTARSCCRCGARTSSSTAGRTCRSGTTRTTAERRRAVPRGEPHVPRAHARGCGRAALPLSVRD